MDRIRWYPDSSKVFFRFKHSVFSVQAKCFFGSSKVFFRFKQSVYSVQAKCFFGSSKVFIRFKQSAFSVQAKCFFGSSTVLFRFKHSAFPIKLSIAAKAAARVRFRERSADCCFGGRGSASWCLRQSCERTTTLWAASLVQIMRKSRTQKSARKDSGLFGELESRRTRIAHNYDCFRLSAIEVEYMGWLSSLGSRNVLAKFTAMAASPKPVANSVIFAAWDAISPAA